MADDSRNAADNYEFRRLQAELRDVARQLENELAQARAEREAAQRQRRARAPEGEAARESSRRRALPRAAVTEEPAAAASVARDADRIAAGQERAARAGQRFEETLRRQRLLLEAGPQRRALPPGAPGGALVPYGGAGGGGGRGGAPPPPGAAPPPGDDDRRRASGLRDTINGYRRQADAARDAASADGAYTSSLRQAVAAGAAYDDSLRRHGALTTEFFSALARGEVTLSELRFQVGATIAKFAGWTAASVAVFGVLDAMRELGKGALDGAAGVNQLSRYITDLDTGRAQQQLIELSKFSNLPIDQVADAFARMGQVFHNQDDAFQATKAALLGVKVGNLEVADSTRFLLAIVRGSGRPAEDLEGIFDRINDAQNKFGAGIRDTTAGVAKATGAWTSAGGSVEFLTSLITAGAAKTGRSGEEMGTAFQRSAEIIRRTTSKNREELESFGVDASKPIDQVYRQAARLVQQGKVKGPDVQRLATALSTPQLATRIVPILQDPDFLNRVDKTLDRSAGSGGRELATVLKSAREEVSKIGNNLERIGVQLLQAGAADPFAVLLRTLNLVLGTTSDILGLFNKLPDPLRSATAVGLEMVAVMKLLGRFGIGPGSLGNLARGGGAIEARRDATRQVDFLRGQAAQESARVQQAAYEHRVAQQIGTAEDREATSAGVRNAERRLAVAEAELAAAVEARAVLERNLKRGISPAVAAAEAGATVPPGARRPGAGRDPAAYAESTPLGVNLLPSAAAAEQAATKTGGISSRVERAGRNAYDGMRRTWEAHYAGIGSATGALTSLRGRLSGFSGALRGFLSDPLFAASAAFFAGEALKSHFEAKGREADRLGRGPLTKAQADAVLSSKATSGVLDSLFGDHSADRAQREADREMALRADQARIKARGIIDPRTGLRKLVSPDQLLAGAPVPNRFAEEIVGDSARAISDLRHGRLTVHQAQAVINRGLEELKHSRSDERNKGAARGQLQQMLFGLGPGRGQSLKDFLSSLPLKEFNQRMEDDATAISVYGFRTARVKDIRAGYRSALAAVRKHPTIANVKRLQAAEQAVDAEVSKQQQDLRDALSLADSPAARGHALDRALRRARGIPDRKKRKLAQDQSYEGFANDVQQGLADDLKLANTIAEKRTAYQRALAQLARVPGRRGTLARQEIRMQSFQDELASFDAQTELGASRFGSNQQVGRDRYLLGRMNTRLARLRAAVRAGNADEKDLWDAEGKRNEQLHQLHDDENQVATAAFESRQALARSRFALSVGGNQRAILRFALTQARQAVANARAHGDGNDVRNALAAVADARLALLQNARQEAQALVQANLAYRQAGIDPGNAVALALSQLHGDEKLLRTVRRDPASTRSERRQQAAAVRGDRFNVLRARQQDRYEDIQFEADIGKITRDQEIHQLQALLKTIKHNKELRRTIQRQIYQLRHENDQAAAFDLNIGNIKLPTVYEIRRAIRGGLNPNSSRNTVVVNNNNKIAMNVQTGADVDSVFARVDEVAGTSIVSAARSAGLR